MLQIILFKLPSESTGYISDYNPHLFSLEETQNETADIGITLEKLVETIIELDNLWNEFLSVS
jgi:hypothetical protein